MLGDHTPSGGLRGGKYSLFEAGTKVPFVAYWKDKIKSGVSDQIISQIDLFNSISKMIDSDIKTEDGNDFSNLILNNTGKGRNDLVIEAMGRTAYRNKEWVMIPPYKGRKIAKNVQIELGNSTDYMLFNLEKDPYQKNNLAKEKPEKFKFMISCFDIIKRYLFFLGMSFLYKPYNLSNFTWFYPSCNYNHVFIWNHNYVIPSKSSSIEDIFRNSLPVS